jgi:hypothetical protein
MEIHFELDLAKELLKLQVPLDRAPTSPGPLFVTMKLANRRTSRFLHSLQQEHRNYLQTNDHFQHKAGSFSSHEKKQ